MWRCCILQSDDEDETRMGGSVEGGQTKDKPKRELDYVDSIVDSLRNKRQTKSQYSEEEAKQMVDDFIAKLDAVKCHIYTSLLESIVLVFSYVLTWVCSGVAFLFDCLPVFDMNRLLKQIVKLMKIIYLLYKN